MVTSASIRVSPNRRKLMAMASSRTSARTRNPRGEGGRLRAEIVEAASELLEQSGSEAAITLRAVARQVGISAPSIYPHFADREEILNAVLSRAFEAMVARLRVAVQGEQDPVARLRAVAPAYVAFAAEQPHRYRVLFDGHRDFQTEVRGSRMGRKSLLTSGFRVSGFRRRPHAGAKSANCMKWLAMWAMSCSSWHKRGGRLTLKTSGLVLVEPHAKTQAVL